MTFHIAMDSVGDIPAAWAQEYGVHILPVNIILGQRTYRDDQDLDAATLVRLVRATGQYPRTSQPSLGQYLAFYRGIARPGEAVLSIHVSQHLSGTYAGAVAAARELAAEGLRVVPFDSQSGSLGMGFLARAAGQARAQGLDLDAALARLRALRERSAVVLALGSLEFIRQSGRVSTLTAALASLLRLYPVLTLDRGRLVVVAKARSMRRALDATVRFVRQRFGERPLHLAVMHALAPERAQRLRERAQAHLHIHELVQGGISAALTAHLGPGTVGLVAYPATPNS